MSFPNAWGVSWGATIPTPGVVPVAALELSPPDPSASNLAAGVGYMNTDETRAISVDFDTQNELLSNPDAAIFSATVVSSDPAGLTVLTSPPVTFDRTEVTPYLRAVVAGTYQVTYTAVLNDGTTTIERVAEVVVY